MSENLDTNGDGPDFLNKDKVKILSTKIPIFGEVIGQTLHYDGPETFWGNVQVQLDDGERRTFHCWQLEKL